MSRSRNTDKRRFDGKWVLPDGSECPHWSKATSDQIMMSRWVFINETPYKQRRCGYEYWSGRPFSGAVPGKRTKEVTHRIERRIAQRNLRKELEDE